ncbi:hypothetical protein MN116_002563 [Schistosoma mekongi]|uniref:Uncharacterized protein n=1 Tax=Schistosoma mekongi TaxID=38744 RepID=A0AAE1ZKJ7_SCHME|nr:hypothetical protein MN116_002563 [Schistosoma mekongi]
MASTSVSSYISYYNQEINHKTTDNINNSSNHINIDNINSLLSLTSSNCNNDYTSKEINISNQSNQLINRLPNTLTIKSIKNTNRLLTNSPHRSTSLIRYQQHNLHDPLREQSIDHDISLSFMPNLCNFDSKSSSLSKESGGKKFLNFLQRGFQSKRPKSMVKSERRRNAKNRSDYVFSSDHYLSRSSSIHSNSMAILCLGEQIQLPKELYNAFSLKPTEFSLTSSEASDENVDDVSHLVQICNIDPSLIGNNCSYYFQVMSPSRKMIKPSSIQLNSSYKQINDVQCSHTSNLIQTTNDSKDNIKEIVNIPFVIHNYSCSSALERDRWVQLMNELINK